MANVRVEFTFDYASPWAYLASEVIERRLPGVTIDPRPIYLRGLESFSKGMPYTSNKLRYLGRDFHRCAAHEGVPTQFPTNFPLNGLYGLRGALALLERGGFPAYHQALFRAAWRDDRDISKKEVVLEVAVESGHSRAEFAEALESQPIKDALKQRTAEADARGVFGVPTFFVGDEPFWGHDRLDYVARALGLSR